MPYARKDQITWLPGHYYHIYNRGARQVTIFREPDKNISIFRPGLSLAAARRAIAAGVD